MKILMVCLGNICRSPLAEGIMQDKANKAGLNWQVDSAGTANYHVGEPPHRLSQKVAKLNGVDISHQCCRQFVKEDMLRFDKIYAMDKDIYNDIKRISRDVWNPSKADLLMNEIHPGKNIDVPDPWYGTEQNYHEVYAMIDKACDAIIEKYAPALKGERLV
ncbi:low molecular weight protein-tyrosine-phosphatase [Parafilimonas sp.]|uniref:low molecular weight protein-tyrosine-phosphatase n=1 Tax=Parafilimonas sp. TaxID=1969739 RepID=UPI0039E25D16